MLGGRGFPLPCGVVGVPFSGELGVYLWVQMEIL